MKLLPLFITLWSIVTATEAVWIISRFGPENAKKQPLTTGAQRTDGKNQLTRTHAKEVDCKVKSKDGYV
jgi:hypothetical protein